MKFLMIAGAVVLAFCCVGRSAFAQTTSSGRPIIVATPTPAPIGTASTSLNTSLTGGGVVNGEGSMGGAAAHLPTGAVAPVTPGQITINSNASSVGTGNVAGSVQINNGGAGSVTGAPVPVSPVPTYVTPGTGLGTPATATTTTNPNPGSVQ